MTKFRARKPRRGGPLPLRYVLLLTFVFFILSTVLGIWIVNKGIAPTLISYAESQNRKIAEIAVNDAKKKILDEIDSSKIVVTDGKYFMANPAISNKVEAEAQEIIQAILNGTENESIATLADLNIVHGSEGLVYSIPIGRATDNALLGNLGPKIPIKLQVIGDVQADLKSNFKSVGINQVYAKVYVQLIVNVQTIIPFETKTEPYRQKISLFDGIIQGDVPQYYNGGSSSQPTIQLPPKK
ncbi:MAG: sporulation protein YunB [Heyndrickxia sp.]